MALNDLLTHFMLNMNMKEGRETIVLKLDKPDEHITFQVRQHERILDLHLTKEGSPGAKKYDTLFRISFFGVGRLIVLLKRAVEQLIDQALTAEDPVDELGLHFQNPGWFRRKHIWAIRTDPEALFQANLFLKRKKGSRIRMNKRLAPEKFSELLNPVDTQLESGSYVLLRSTRNGGVSHVGILRVIRGRQKRFLLLSKQTQNRLLTRYAGPIIEVLAQQNMNGVTEAKAMLSRRFTQAQHGARAKGDKRDAE